MVFMQTLLSHLLFIYSNVAIETRGLFLAVVTPTDRPTSARNSCVIEVFGDVFVLCCHVAFWILLLVYGLLSYD